MDKDEMLMTHLAQTLPELEGLFSGTLDPRYRFALDHIKAAIIWLERSEENQED